MIGKILYGTLFCAALPLLLVLWASNVTIKIQMDDWSIYGWILCGVGAVIMFTAMHNLYFIGKGLPMNAYPPKVYVTRGMYSVLKHPIYVAFCFITAGVSCIVNSSAGLFLVTPVIAILCVALVYGYEGPDIEKRFGKQTKEIGHGTLVSLFGGWLIFYEALVSVGYDDKYINTQLWFEKDWPVIEIAEIPYALTYLVFVVPFFARDKRSLSSYVSLATFMIIAGLFLQYVFPFYCSPRDPVATTTLGKFILYERSIDGPAAAFPSFHAIWILITAWFLFKEFPRYRFIILVITLIMLWSCSATGVHSLPDILAAILLFAIGINREKIWHGFQRRTEIIANSWRSFHVGRARVINHVIYSALAGFAGVIITGQFTHDVIAVGIVAVCSLLGAMLWGQWVEGSPHMLRPMGYFGSILGGLTGIALVSTVRGVAPMTMIGAIALAAPWTQAIGRLRCLVQGCCHGRPSDTFGIRVFNTHSRVHANPKLTGERIHNTQLYSIASNVIIGLVLARIQFAGAPATLIAGLYFILSGASRFVEEAYRGESQTKVIAGLKIYQWLSIVSILSGCVLTTIVSTPIIPVAGLSWSLLSSAFVVSAAWAFGMSIDFPRSNARFARLTG